MQLVQTTQQMEETNPIGPEPQDELYEHFSFTASEGQEPLRVDKFLMNFIENATRNKIQKAAKNGSIEVNGKVVKQNYKVKAATPYAFFLSTHHLKTY